MGRATWIVLGLSALPSRPQDAFAAPQRTGLGHKIELKASGGLRGSVRVAELPGRICLPPAGRPPRFLWPFARSFLHIDGWEGKAPEEGVTRPRFRHYHS